MRVYCYLAALLTLACAAETQTAVHSGTAGRGGADVGEGGSAGQTSGCPAPIDLGVHIVGRHDGCDASGVRMAWSGTGFIAHFSGTGIRFTQQGASLQYTVLIDGALADNLVTTSGTSTYEIASGLENTEHVVEVYRRGEASFGFAVLQSVEVTGGTLLQAPPPAARRLEVVGDSISCGYGNEGDSASCSFSADTENHYLTYGAVLARSFDAELSTVAWSGKGVVINYGGELSTTMPQLYERAIPTDSTSVWNFAWQPQAVIINLATNDYSTDNDPPDDEFIAGYVDLLETIRGRYSDAFILCTLGPLLSGTDLATARANIQQAVDLRREAGDENIATYELNADNPDPGCDWHPSIDTHAAMANELSAPIADALGW